MLVGTGVLDGPFVFWTCNARPYGVCFKLNHPLFPCFLKRKGVQGEGETFFQKSFSLPLHYLSQSIIPIRRVFS